MQALAKHKVRYGEAPNASYPKQECDLILFLKDNRDGEV